MNKCRIQIRVQPNAKKTGWAGLWNGTHHKISLKAPAVDGKANDALISFLSDYFQLPKKNFTLVLGQTNKCKIVEINGYSQDQLNIPE